MKNEDKALSVGHIPSGLFIVTAKDEQGKIDGYLASWVQQISFNPLRVTLAVKPGRPAYESIKSGSTFVVNIVGEHDKKFMGHFWSGYDPANNPFDSKVEWKEGEHGGVLIPAARSAFECKMVDSYNPGDHELVVAEVLESYNFAAEASSVVHLRKSGTDY